MQQVEHLLGMPVLHGVPGSVLATPLPNQFPTHVHPGRQTVMAQVRYQNVVPGSWFQPRPAPAISGI